MSWLRRRTGPDIKGWHFMAINDACGWRRAMAYIGSSQDGLGLLLGGRYPIRNHWSGLGFDLGDEAGGHGGPDDVVAAVVLAGDAVEGLAGDWSR